MIMRHLFDTIVTLAMFTYKVRRLSISLLLLKWCDNSIFNWPSETLLIRSDSGKFFVCHYNTSNNRFKRLFMILISQTMQEFITMAKTKWLLYQIWPDILHSVHEINISGGFLEYLLCLRMRRSYLIPIITHIRISSLSLPFNSMNTMHVTFVSILSINAVQMSLNSMLMYKIVR